MRNQKINVENLTVSYHKQPVFEQLSVEIAPHKLTGIIGPNGAGKSTFMKALLGLVPKNDGKITLGGKPLRTYQKEIAYIEQRTKLDTSFPIDVFGVVLMGTYPSLKIGRRPRKQEKERAKQALEKVGMEDYAKRQIGELSGGQLQRVLIARALVQEAQWLFLDEPFAGIDAVSEKLIFDLLKELKEEGKSIVIVHHDLHKVADYFDDVILLNKGVVAYGSVPETFTLKNLNQAYGMMFDYFGTESGEQK
ncbi:putative manganese transport system ATP-binding protein MntA [Enterococcus faecalis 13-SD-W-01]|nr:putative manganese transport system ATP-binding protein MntA [Enterococcus faecalis 13-SD-W-01]